MRPGPIFRANPWKAGTHDTANADLQVWSLFQVANPRVSPSHVQNASSGSAMIPSSNPINEFQILNVEQGPNAVSAIFSAKTVSSPVVQSRKKKAPSMSRKANRIPSSVTCALADKTIKAVKTTDAKTFIPQVVAAVDDRRKSYSALVTSVNRTKPPPP
jgi:hypothetical protein